MKPKEVLELAKQAVLDGGLDYTNHFLDRMVDRDARVGDVKRSIKTATDAEEQDNGTWRLKGGRDTDDVSLVPVIVVRSDGKIRLVTILD